MPGPTLYVDDQAHTDRAAEAAPYTHTALTAPAALRLLGGWAHAGVVPAAVSLDHDLGGDATTRPIVLWWCTHGHWPTAITIHTRNPVGAEWLHGMCTRYAPPGTTVHRR